MRIKSRLLERIKEKKIQAKEDGYFLLEDLKYFHLPPDHVYYMSLSKFPYFQNQKIKIVSSEEALLLMIRNITTALIFKSNEEIIQARKNYYERLGLNLIF